MDTRLVWAVAAIVLFDAFSWGVGVTQEQPSPASDQTPPPAVSIVTPAPSVPPADQTPTNSVTPADEPTIASVPKSPPPAAKVEPPPGPPKPARSPVAILRVLDKVTAETLRFEAPVGRRVRYKTLIFTVKACETRNGADALPRPSAYLVIESQAGALPGRPAPAAKEVFRGWMFANRPGLNPFEHPVYDAWLDVCSDAPSPA